MRSLPDNLVKLRSLTRCMSVLKMLATVMVTAELCASGYPTWAAALGHARGIRLSSHLWSELSAQLLCATPTAHSLEYSDWWNAILREPLAVERGMAQVEHAEATGVAWNDRAVEKFAI